jgi:hypothetical protein
MASVPGAVSLPNPKTKTKRKKIDIPYDRWPNRIRRAIRSFIKITLLISLRFTIYFLATIDDVTLNMFFSALGVVVSLVIQIMAVLFSIILQLGCCSGFSRAPKWRSSAPVTTPR